MAVSMQTARTLCTKAELDLVLASSSSAISKLSAAQLRAKRERTRKLRDKFRDLGDKQRREIRGKNTNRTAKPAQDNRATRTKQQLFSETLERFEQALASVEATAPAAGSTAQGASGGTRAASPSGKKVRRKNTRASVKAAAIQASKKTAKKTSKTRKKAKVSEATPTAAPARAMKTKMAKAATPAAAEVATQPAKKAAKKSKASSTGTTPKSAKSLKAMAGSKASKASIVGGKSVKRPAAGGQGTGKLSEARKKRAKKKIAATTAEGINISRQEHAADAVPKSKKLKLEKGGEKRFQGHISSRGRRNQAKRDSK